MGAPLHVAAFALQFAFYNFCHPHETLTDATKVEGREKVKTTPAMAAGIADHPWTLEELVRNTMPTDNLFVPARMVVYGAAIGRLLPINLRE